MDIYQSVFNASYANIRVSVNLRFQRFIQRAGKFKYSLHIFVVLKIFNYDNNIPVFITSQTLYGRVDPFVYSNLRKVSIEAKGIYLRDILPETAYIKLGWVLGQVKDYEKVKEMMLTPVNDEITLREPYNGYLVYQGGVPEVEEFVRNVHK